MSAREWWENPSELIAFANWYWEGTANRSSREILEFFEKPWKWKTEYQWYQANTK